MKIENVNEALTPAKLVYVLYMLSLLTGFSAVVAVIIAYIYRGDAPDWLKSHFTFQIRTFWIGALYICIGWITLPILIGVLVLLFTMLWLIIRSVKGLKVLNKQLEHPFKNGWML